MRCDVCGREVSVLLYYNNLRVCELCYEKIERTGYVPENKKSYVFFLRPSKTFDEIEEEYSVKFSEKELIKLAELMVELYIKKEAKKVVEYIEELGKKKGLKDKKLAYFVYDVLRTSMFYLKTFHIMEKLLEGREKC